MKSFPMPQSFDLQKYTERVIPSSTTTLAATILLSGEEAIGEICPFIAKEISPPRDPCSPPILALALWLLLRHQVGKILLMKGVRLV